MSCFATNRLAPSIREPVSWSLRLTRVNKEFGTTTIIITHNVAIRTIADRVVNFANGQIASIDVNAERRPASSVTW